MSLATRCPACGTVFRVVSDQLKVSEGWVRCGRCTEVFHATQRLFELGPEAAPAAPPPDRPVAEVHRLPLRDPTPAGLAAARVSATLAPPAAVVEAEPEPSAEAAPDEVPAERPAQPATDAVAVLEEGGPQADGAAAEMPPTVEPAKEQPAEAASPTPTFVRRAERAARWRHPARRATLAAVALLLLALLCGQMALHYRDHVAAAWPGTRPWLQAVCNMAGCRIEAPRRIDALIVDSSGLVRLQDSPLYRLSLVVQNKAATDVRLPAIDLALTDGQGQTTLRRVLTAAELGSAVDRLPAGGEVTLQATLDLGEQRVVGYTVELFYP